jgi:hypothetical protein
LNAILGRPSSIQSLTKDVGTMTDKQTLEKKLYSEKIINLFPFAVIVNEPSKEPLDTEWIHALPYRFNPLPWLNHEHICHLMGQLDTIYSRSGRFKEILPVMEKTLDYFDRFDRQKDQHRWFFQAPEHYPSLASVSCNVAQYKLAEGTKDASEWAKTALKWADRSKDKNERLTSTMATYFGLGQLSEVVTEHDSCQNRTKKKPN